MVSKTVFPFVIIVGGEHNAIVHKNEVVWIKELAAKLAVEYKTRSYDLSGMEASLAVLRAEQLTVISDKLGRVLEAGNKRIEIKY